MKRWVRSLAHYLCDDEMWRPWWLWERGGGWVGHGASWRLKNRYIKIPLLWVDADDDACPGHHRYAHFTTGKQVIYVPRWCSQCGPRATSLISEQSRPALCSKKYCCLLLTHAGGSFKWVKSKGKSNKSLSKFAFTHSHTLKIFGSKCAGVIDTRQPSFTKPR